MSSPTPCVSFIGIVDFSEKAKWLYMTESVSDLLGYEPHELIGKPSLELVHPDEFPRVKQLHYDTISQDKAAVLVYLRMKHKDPKRGYVLCGVSRTVVHNVLVGSVSFASSTKAMYNASTAQEITVITPGIANFEFRRWHDPSPMPPSPIPPEMQMLPLSPSPSPSDDSWASRPRSSSPPSPPSRSRSRSPSARPRYPDSHARTPLRRPSASASDSDSSTNTNSPRSSYAPRSVARRPTPSPPRVITFPPLPSKSFRTAFILDRFSYMCPIMYASNDLLVSASGALGRSFFDFVRARDETVVRDWIACVKGWGVNEMGAPSDGGFGFGKFGLLVGGRESMPRIPDPAPRQRIRRPSQSGRGARPARYTREGSVHDSGRQSHSGRVSHGPSGRAPSQRDTGGASSTALVDGDEGEHFLVDAIFSAHSDGLMVILRRASESYD